MSLPLSRILQASDPLPAHLQHIVHDRFESRQPQHNARKVEYTSVLHAIEQIALESPLKLIVDVGGAGSPLSLMVKDVTGVMPLVVDPADDIANCDLHTYLQHNPQLADLVLCISVIEHVKDEAQFLYDLSCLVAPGGWLILTMDFATTVPDTYHFHWMRERIYTPLAMVTMQEKCAINRMDRWPWTPAPNYCIPFTPLVHDYGFCSLVLRKRVKP